MASKPLPGFIQVRMKVPWFVSLFVTQLMDCFHQHPSSVESRLSVCMHVGVYVHVCLCMCIRIYVCRDKIFGRLPQLIAVSVLFFSH